jgi:toluene monooxygenase system ferredoxin subunit
MNKNIHVCKMSDIPANSIRDFVIEGGEKVLIANFSKRYYAYNGNCPHQGTCLADGFFDGAVLTCSKHLWQWDITTGKPIGLAEAPLQGYQVEIENDEIFVRQASALKMAELFADISSATQNRLVQLTRREEYESGSVLYDLGDVTDDLYILESGRVAFELGRDDRTSAAGFILRRGEVFGWAALLEHQPVRIAKAVCVEQSTLLRLNGEEAVKVLASDPDSGYLVMRQLATLITRHFTSSSEI